MCKEGSAGQMTLEEAIEHALWCASNSSGECSDEHRQLALWLTELKRLRDRIHEIADERDRLKVENGRLYRLVDGLWYCANKGCGMCALKEVGSAKPYTCCPLYDYETHEYGCRKLMCELGIEASE